MSTISGAFHEFARLLEEESEKELWSDEARQALLISSYKARDVAEYAFEEYEGV